MYILTLRTDNPEAEIGLYKDTAQISYQTWQAHRQLAETLHLRIQEVLNAQSLSLKDLRGLVVYQGPGSFTGLRIGITVANALADSLTIPICGQLGEDWREAGAARIIAGASDKIVLPEYGALPNITAPKK
ncbi:MAG: tRNA (adenosine(37)-N6)-threonylcarbamoyltransferase complex dimerization subunit type 1 TsaB [Patescibacteria group bacterium]|nr:tRNA (adenosine(37)-N6)-threonylcarbamoyltransferase complex dimerization subunit type 1 TsaB [Patescibacteria group bacterium]